MNTQENTQEIFDKVAKHLIAQGERSADPEGYNCLYRGPEGRSCAVGCLIDDEYYSAQDLEGRGVSHPPVRRAVEMSIGRSLTHTEELLLRHVQAIHDDNDPDEWPGLLRDAASAYGLIRPV